MTKTAPLILLLTAMPIQALAADPAAQLKAGGILSASVPTGGVGVWPGRAMALVDASPEIVQQVLANVADYRAFVPRILASRQVKPGRFVVDLDLPWPVNRTWAYVQVAQSEQGSVRVLQWRMLNGTLKRYEGTAWIQPWGAKTLLTYQILAEPHTVAPAGLINGGLRDAATTVIEAVRKRTAKLTVRVASKTMY
jgi:ribosome-associated toxin RatA of RatAB toxin-antitoxin module